MVKNEVGRNVNQAAKSNGGWFVGAIAKHFIPHIGHTMTDIQQKVEWIAKKKETSTCKYGILRSRIPERHPGLCRKAKTQTDIKEHDALLYKAMGSIESGIGHLKRHAATIIQKPFAISCKA